MISFKYSKFLYLLVFALQISLFFRQNLVSYLYSLVGIWITVLHNRCCKCRYFVFAYSLCILISLLTLLLDLLYSLNIISGDIFQAIGISQISSFLNFFTVCTMDIVIIVLAILAISRDRSYNRPVVYFFILFT